MGIPNTQDEFFDWQDNFMAMVLLNLLPWSINGTQWSALQALQTTYLTAYRVGKKGNKANRTPTQTKAKTDAENDFQGNAFGLENFITNNIAKNQKITNAQRLSLGTTIYLKKYSKVPRPDTIPVNSYSAGNGNTVKAGYRQQPDTKGVSKRGKAKGAARIEYGIFVAYPLPADDKGVVATTAVPVNPDKFGRFESGTKTPVPLGFPPEESGLMGSFASRWITATNLKGDWSSIQNFRIP